jgi:hypothetical protein
MMKKIILLLVVSIFIASCAMLDKIPPTLEVSVSKLTNFAGEDIVLNVVASDQSGIDRIEIYANDKKIHTATQSGEISFPAPYGSFTLKVVVFDRAGNHSSKVVGSFKTKDMKEPVVSLEYSPKGPKPDEMVVVHVSAEDSESGVRIVGLRINKKEVDLVEGKYSFQAQAGSYQLEAYAKDNEGNESVAKTTINVSVVGDSSGPEIEFLNLPVKVAPGTNANITILAKDESGISKITFNDGQEIMYIPTNPATEILWNLTRNVGSNDPYSFTVTAYDSRNNYTVLPGSIKVGTNLPPSISIQVDNPTPKEGDVVRIEISASDDSRVNQVVLYIDNVSIRTFTQEPYIHEWIAIKGIHKIKAVAMDDSGGSTESVYTINVGVIDTEAPVIYFTPPYGVPVNEAYTFYVFATDNVQVQEVTFQFTGPENKGPLKASSMGGGVFTLTETFTQKGNYEVIVVAKDSSENSSSQKGQFPVDEAYIVKAPKIKEFSYAPSILNQGETVHFKVVAQDDLGLSKCDFYVNDIKRSSTTPVVNTFEWDWIATTLGAHNVKVVVVDSEGFTAEATGTVIVVTERPIAKILQPEEGFRTPFAQNMSLSLNAQVVDTNKPSEAYFDIKGPVDEKIPVVAIGDGPVYTFNAQWEIQSSGEYQIDFYYKNDINLSDATSVSVNILDLGVVFEQPLPGQQHQCGYDLIVRAKVSVYLTENEKFEISYASRKLELSVPDPIVTTSTYSIYQTTIPSTFFSEPGTYTLNFSGKTTAGEEGVGRTTVNVVDSQPPIITQARVNSQDIVEGGIYDVAMSSTPTVNIVASDNRQIASIQLQKKISGTYTNLSTSSSNTLICDIPLSKLDPFENYFKIIVTDLDNNQTTRNFVIFAYEQTPPEIDYFRTMQLYPPADIYDMGAQLLIQIRGSFNNNTQFKVTDDTGIKEVRIRIVDNETNGGLYEQTVKKLYEYTGTMLKEKFISNQDVPMFTPAQVGSFKVNLEAVDVFDNTTLIAQQDLVVEDLTAPIVHLDIPEGKYYGTNNDGKKIIRTVSDVKVSFLDNTEPIYKVELWITDPSGRTEKIGEKSDLATNSWTFENISLTSYSDGVARFRAIATTTSGATGEGEIPVILDNKEEIAVTMQLPDTETFGNRSIYRGTIEIAAQITGTDVPYDVQKVELYVDDIKKATITSPVENGEYRYVFALNTAIYNDGTHKLALKVYDCADNESNMENVNSFKEVLFDNSAPTLLSDSGRIYTNEENITLQIEESYGVQEAYLIINGEPILPQSNFTFVHGLSQNSSAPFSLYLKDTAGNIANYSGTLYYDTLPPNNISIDFEPSPIASGTVTFNLSFSDNLSGMKALNVYENGLLIETINLSREEVSRIVEYNPPENYEGSKTIRFEIYDRANNKSEISQDVSIDTLAPRINQFTCDATFVIDTYYTNQGNVNVIWDSEDDNFLKAELTKGSATFLETQSGTHSFGLDLGMNNINLAIYDQVGHVTNGTIAIMYDNLSPIISNVEFNGQSIHESEVATSTSGNKPLRFDVSEPYIDWERCFIYVNNSPTLPGDEWEKSDEGDNTYSVSISVNIAVDSTIQIVLKDYAGNSRKYEFSVDVQ